MPALNELHLQEPIPQLIAGNEDHCEIDLDSALSFAIIKLVEQANAEGRVHLFSKALLNCYISLAQNKKVLKADIKEALPELIAYFEGKVAELVDRAPRQSEGQFIVGPGVCDLATVISLLRQLQQDLNECCATLEADLNATLTILVDFANTFSLFEELVNELQSSVTILVEAVDGLESTVTLLVEAVDELVATSTTITSLLQGTFTVLDEGFNSTYTSFEATWTILADIQNSLTSCQCLSEFQQTWTILEDLKNSSTDCDCLAEFQQTWTILEDLNATISSDFQQTWTILADIRASLSCQCLEEFQETWTILQAGFNGTYTAIAQGFQQTWTILDALTENQPFVTVYGDEVVSTRQDYISTKFQYGISSFDTTTSTFAGGFVNSFTSMAIIGTGTGATAFAQLQSIRNIRYRPGHESYGFFTAMFPNGSAANSKQYIGLFDGLNGVAVGYTNTDFSILYRREGVDTIITQANFNGDTLNGAGASGFVLTTSNLNVFRISYGWLGASPIKFQIIDQNGKWITFHEIISNNLVSGPTFLSPDLPLTAQVVKTAGASDLRIATPCWSGGVVGEPSAASSRFFSAISLATLLPAAGEAHLLTIRNKNTFQSRPNKVEIRVGSFTGGTVTTAAEVSVIRIRLGATVTGTAFTNVDTANSVMEFSTAGTYIAGTGMQALAIPNSSTGSGPFVVFLPVADLNIYLLPGQSLTITGESLSGGGNTAITTIGWEELF